MGLKVALQQIGGTRSRPATPFLVAVACSLLAPGPPVAAADGSTGSASRANTAGYEPYVTVGIAAVRSSGARFVDGADAGHAALYGSGNTFDDGTFDAGFTVDVAAGVRLGSALRAQLEFGVAGALNYRGNTNYRNAGAHQPSEAVLDLSQAFLVGFYEFPDWELSSSRRVSPFLGAGAGVTTYRLSGYVQRFPDPENPHGSLRSGPGGEIPFTAIPDGRHRNRSWMLTGGVSIPIRERFQLDLGYRYTDAGTIRTRTGDITIVRYREEGTRRQIQVPINETSAKLQTHALFMTLRFDL
ncbi:MAG: outer membrane beta-barrel protein [Proteobacteria bacterium]|nr:outer membrane beta-barrel protein [Pseudomonadota bacterium]